MSGLTKASTARSKQAAAAIEVIDRFQTMLKAHPPVAVPAADTVSIETGILDSLRLVNLLLLHVERECAIADSLDDVDLEELRRLRAISHFLASTFSGDSQETAS